MFKGLEPINYGGREVWPLVEGGKGVSATNHASSGAWAAAGGIGTVSAVNDEVAKAPEKVNADAYAAWLFRLQPEQATAVDALLDARGYQSVIAED